MVNFNRILAATGDLGIVSAARRLASLDSSSSVDQVHVDTPAGKPVLDELLERAMDIRADLLVVGARSHALASRAAMLAPCSVLMVPDHAELRFDKIAIPVDFSDSAAEAARCGVGLAEKAGGDWVALTVECAEEPWLDWNQDPGIMRFRLEQFVTAATDRVPAGRCLVEPLDRAGTGLPFSDGSEGVAIASTIVKAVERLGASLIVMGSRGRTNSAWMLLGSVTEYVMRATNCPVLALRRSGGQMGVFEAARERARHAELSVVE